jgi:NadR type nicotinamide-nucleotide adenylyltransferase
MKAFPFHRGHEFLISEAVRQSEHVSILLVWGYDQNPNGELRKTWIEKTFPSVDVHLVVDLYTDDNEEDKAKAELDSYMWAIYAQDTLKGDTVDVVFSSEVYGDSWARQLGVPHVCVDLNRTYLPISGTEIRRDPYLYWNYMNRYARQYYLKRVLVVGPESTGKTTLCKNLSLLYSTVYSPEYGRIYDEQTRKPNEDFDEARYRAIYANIVNEQPVLNARAEADAQHVCFYDTDLMTTAMWYKEWQETAGEDGLYWSIIQAAKAQPKFDLVIVQGMAPWVDDGMRGQTQEIRDKFYDRLLKDHKDESMVILSGEWQERQNFAIDAINSLFKGSDVTLPRPIYAQPRAGVGVAM